MLKSGLLRKFEIKVEKRSGNATDRGRTGDGKAEKRWILLMRGKKTFLVAAEAMLCATVNWAFVSAGDVAGFAPSPTPLRSAVAEARSWTGKKSLVWICGQRLDGLFTTFANDFLVNHLSASTSLVLHRCFACM